MALRRDASKRIRPVKTGRAGVAKPEGQRQGRATAGPRGALSG